MPRAPHWFVVAPLHSTLWDDVLGQVRLTHPSLTRGWFKDLAVNDLKHGVLEIVARNSAQTRYLDEHCKGSFQEAAQAATGRLVTIRFRPENEDDPDLNFHSSSSADEELPLNSEYVFEHFVTGPCNRLAHAAAVAVAEEPGRAYNPFFVHGPVGLGKTHLLQAINHVIRERNPRAKYLYISCETFINHFIEAVERGAMHQFRYRYRHVDGLIIDDVQFLAKRERSQEAFFHTFNALYQSDRQIILSADCSPAEIPSLEERLVSRFNSGLVALLDRPCLETRMAIVRKKAKLRCIEVPEEVVQIVASKIDTNIRDLEGALIKLDAMSQAQDGKITLELAWREFGTTPGRPIPIPAILEAVAARFRLRVSELQGKKRSKIITHPRHISMFLARQLTSQSLEDIGGYFGGRDHTTVLHASRTIARQMKADSALQALVDDISKEVKNGPI